MMAKLTPKQQAFCEEYLIDLNARQAAIRAGYKKTSASEQGYENLNKPQIAERITSLMAERSRKTSIDAAWVLKEAVKSYSFNAGEVADTDGNPKMVNAASASKFLEMCGKHVDVKAFDNDVVTTDDKPLKIEFVRAKKPEKH